MDSLTKIINLVIDIVIMTLSIFFLVLTFFEAKSDKKIKNSFIKIFSSEFVYALSHFFGIYFKGDTSDFAKVIIPICNFLEYSLVFVLFIFFSDYILNELNDENKKKEKILLISLSSVAILINFINLFTGFIYYIDENNVYHRGTLFFLPSIFMLLFCTFVFIIIILNYKNLKRRTLIAFLTCTLLPIIGSIVQAFVYGYSFVIIGIFLSTIYIFFTMIIEETNKAARQEAELLKINNQIMLSQINPHFLFNALTSIMYLCDKDPKEAKEAVHDFSIYLRNNLDSINASELIPFEKEIEHILAYIKIENRRFNNKINLSFDIKCYDFMVPPLSIETLVENSVKHGLFVKDKGTIIIKTYKDDDFITVKIKDDGEGFDADETIQEIESGERKKSYGLSTSIKRLKHSLNATLTIDSKINEGTLISIKIPVGGKKR